jgi:hypothetical protein
MTNIERTGPILGPSTIAWLDAGGPFPDQLVVTTMGPNYEKYTQHFEILGRDAGGHIKALASSARRGKKGFVLQVKEHLGTRLLAAKLTIPEDFDGATPLKDLEYAKRLKGAGRLIHVPDSVGTVAPFASEGARTGGRPWVCFISDWLPGRTVADLLEQSPEMVTAELVSKIAIDLLTGVLYVEANGLKHDDLHLGNLMLVEADPSLKKIDPARGDPHLTIIDIGSMKDLDRATKKEDDDWSSVAKCLAALYNTLHQNRREASRYPEFMALFKTFITQLADENPSRFFPDTGDYVANLRVAADNITLQPRAKRAFTPFSAISAEHLASDELLLELFVEQLPWIELVSKDEPCLLYGPRGCGKSMVFRYLSVRTHVANRLATPAAIARTGFFGVYIGCSSDLGNDLQWLSREPGRVARHAHDITTYFNLVLGRELLRAMAVCGQAPQIANCLGLSEQAKRSITDHLVEQCNSALAMTRISGMDLLQTCVDALDQARLRLGRALLSGDTSPLFALSTTFIRDLCRHINAVAPGFREHRITFLLDDYTETRLHSEIQKILNTVVWQRDNSHTFKVSSEPYGFDTTHHDGARIDPNREFTPIDAGLLTLGNDRRVDRRAFITKLLNKRLHSATYKGTAETLIGNSSYTEDTELAAAIRGDKNTSRTGRKTYYHGLHVLSDAWSGDVATILHITREMFARARIDKDSVDTIKPEIQHESIVKIANGMRARVQGFHPHGEEMYRIMAAFGDTAARILVDGKLQDVDGRLQPQRRYRFEMSLAPGTSLDSELITMPNGAHLVELRKELVRRGVFIEHLESRGKESPGHRTVRWELRTSVLPSFGTSLIRKDYIDIKRIEDFVELLTKPQVYMEQVWLRYGADSSLFDNPQQELLP